MADLSSLLRVLENDPSALDAEAVLAAARQATPEIRAARFAEARKSLGDRGRPDAQLRLVELELQATTDTDRQADLLLEQGLLLDGELLDVPGARAAFELVRALRPDDALASEAIEELDVAASNWQKFADKFVKEASASTDRSLATGLYVSAAEAYVRFAPDAPEAEGHLRKALEIDPRNGKAAFHLERVLRRAARWPELASLLEQRAELGATTADKIAALLALAEVARAELGADGAVRADTAIRRALQLDPAQPAALRSLTDQLARAGDWAALVATYQAALKARRDGDDLGILLQIAMGLWKHLGDLDQAEEYFRRVRKLEPAHPAALDFYRAYYPAKGEHQKLLAMLRQVERSPATPRAHRDSQRPLGLEIAELAEAQNNPDKAIEAWKQVLRAEPTGEGAGRAREALLRLYRRTEKWNALLDVMKEDIERLPEDDVAGRVARMHEVVEIYRDKLRLDVMVINTYHAILKLDPDNARATDELAAKLRALGRWNDLIAVLARKAEAPALDDGERVALLREIADLWAERFGNFANAIKPLERILEIAPADDNALARLKEIYTKRRQWRALIDVLGREASVLRGAERRGKHSEMARLAAERLGDNRLAIEIHNGVLRDVDDADARGGALGETLASLAALYEREKRWLPLAEILHRQVAAASGREAIALLEKLGQVYADRAGAPQAAADVWQQVLAIEPGHAKALRTLRELYATAGDFHGLEALYARLGQEEELVDALLAIADRLENKAQRLPLVERAAQLAQQRADASAADPAAATTATPAPIAPVPSGPAARSSAIRGKRGQTVDESPADHALERARQVWERVLSVEPQHTGAAAALAPIYARQEKWAKLITILEIELAAAPDDRARLAKIAEIRALTEQRLASRTLAFSWTLRAFELDPASEPVFADLLRLANEPEQWREVAAAFDRHARGRVLDAPTRLRLFRELAKIASRRLTDPERARGYHREVIALAPEDRDAEQHLEELAIQLADWPELLASYRRRAAREPDAHDKASLLNEIASLQEEKLVDLDGAAATYHESLGVLPGQLRALRALARIEEARGDWDSLVGVLAAELEETPATGDGQGRFDLLMRLGTLEEVSLERPSQALRYFRDALAVTAPGGAARPQAVGAIARYLPGDQEPGSRVEPGERVAAARLVLPHVEAARNLGLHARALEVIRAGEGTAAAERLELDRRLLRLYHIDLGDPGAAWTTGLRVLTAAPDDAEVRAALCALAGQLGRDGEWARELAAALTRLRERSAAPAAIRAVATDLAQVASQRLDDQATAERAWLGVLEVEPDASDAFEALTAMYRAAGRWPELRALLERRVGRVSVTHDDRVRLAVLLEIAALEEDVLADAPAAIAAHLRVLDLEAGYGPAFSALDRLYTAAGAWTELEGLLARQTEHVRAPREQTELSYRRAELFAHRLGDPARSVDLLDEVIARHRNHADARELLEELLPDAAVAMRVARLLEPLYEQDKLWKDLVGVLRAQRKLVGGTEAVELLSRIATIEEAELGGGRSAFDAWSEVLGLDPTHERARVELARLAQQLGRWSEATAALEQAAAAAPAGDVATRAALLGELAAYYDLQLGDGARAITAYRRLLELDGSNPAAVRKAGAALARLYEAASDWAALRAVVRRQAEWAEAQGERRALLARVAGLEENQLADRAAAIATWRDILDDQPADAGALDALERLYQAAEQWRELIDVLRRKLDLAGTTPDAARELLTRIAEIHEVMLEEPDEAIAAHLEALDRDPEDRHALDELARLYREAGRHADLLDVLERQVALALAGPGGPGARVAIQLEIATLLGGALARPAEALDRWADVLEVEPQHPQAIAAVENALGDGELRLAAADVLRPVYEATGSYAELAALQLRAAEWADDAPAKLRALADVVQLREHRLGDRAGAFAAQLLALRHAATEPELARVVAETERLAGDLGREGDLIDAYREVAPHVLDAEIQRRLYLDVADLSRAVRQDLPLAREYYEKVLQAQPDDRRALAALEAIHRDTNDDEALTEVLLRQADAASADVDDRVIALVEAAGLYVQLRRPDDAIATWEQVLAVAPERRDAVDALEGLYREQGRWPDVVDLYERRLGFATTIDEAVELRVALGEIHEQHLRDFETAIDNFSAALSGDPRNATALEAVERYLIDPDLRVVAAEVLEPIYVAQQRWADLIRVSEARLASATDPADRLQLIRFVARLYEEQLEDFERASEWYARVFREAPSDASVRDQLQRLAQIVDNWDFVADTYQQFLDDSDQAPVPVEPGDLRDIAIAAATIYHRRLANLDRAYAAYRRALAIEVEDAIPDERELIKRLAAMLSPAQRWRELVAIYDDVAARAEDPLRREVLVERARLQEDGLGDPAAAIDGWREVVAATESDPSTIHAYREAVGELERLHTAAGQWRELVALLEARISHALGNGAHDNELADLRLRLGELLELRLADLPAAIDQYEQVIEGGAGRDRAVAALERLVVHEALRERIAELLEPVYRSEDWWQKLVVILDAKLDYVRDPLDQVAVLHEIAQIHEQRGGALDLALQALARAWRIDVAEEDSLAKLLSLASKLGAWDEAVATLEDGAAAAGTGANSELAAALWTRAAEIHEARRGDLPAAIAAWRQVEKAQPDELAPLAALDRLLAVTNRVTELVAVVARRAELTEDAGTRLVLLHRVAALYEEVLGDPPAAIAAYKNVLGVDDTDLVALEALERLYRDAGDGRELAQTLERKIELTTELAARQALRRAAAVVYEQQLDDVYQAIGQLTAVLDDDASDGPALAELDRIYAKAKLWPELLDVIDRRAALATEPGERADLGYRAAHLVEAELVDPEAAIPRYGAVLAAYPAQAAARAALEALLLDDRHVEAVAGVLERVYRAEREAAGLIRVYERRLAVGSGDARADWAALAEVHETLAGSPTAAFGVWSRAIAADPDDVELLVPLTRLAEGDASLWPQLAQRLDALLAGPLPPDAEQAYAMKLGAIAEDKLADAALATRAYERAAAGAEPRPALSALERVLARASDWRALSGVLRRQVEAADDDATAAGFGVRLGELHETTLGEPAAAVAAYREVLAMVPAQAEARAALERLLVSAPDQRGDIVEVLEPLFEQDGDAARLAGVLEARLALTADPIDRAALLQRLVELFEQRLADLGRALDAALRWLAVEPGSRQALYDTERLAGQLAQWGDVAQRVSAIAHAPGAEQRDPDAQIALLAFLGTVQRDRLGQLEEAAQTYRAALAIDGEDLAVLDELIVILRQRGDQRSLADALRQRGRAISELPEKRAAFAEVAQLLERAGDRDAAIAAWVEIVDGDETDRAALDELARLYRSTAQRAALIDALDRAAQLATEPTDEKALRVEIAQLESDARAVSAWQAVLDLDPEDASALSALEAAYARAADWLAVADVQTRRLALARTTAEQVAIHAEMAQVAETRRGSVDDAIASWYAALDADSAHAPAYAELERLLAAGERWHDLVELLERRAELAASRNEQAAELAALARAADVWEAQLDNPEAAGEILEAILAREPGSVSALTRLSKIYERAGDWERCKATLEQALALSPTGREAADLFFRLGEVARDAGDIDTAVLHDQQALKHDPAHGPAIAALEAIARDRRDHALLADLLGRRIAAATTETSELIALRVELADLERRAGRPDAALAALAAARAAAPDDVRVLGPLADLYFATERLDEAAPIYDRLAEEAKAGRRMKDVARFRQRQGGILEARGDRAGALAAYEEALRVNPTDVSTMVGLGRLYFAAEDWEKARRIYQSLVLQSIEPESGATKGAVYWSLGQIHLRLGQAPKAKSMFQRGLELEPGNEQLLAALAAL